MAEAQKQNWQNHNWKMAIAVVGPFGQLIAEATMNDTQYSSIDVAQGKARSAAWFRRPREAFSDLVNKRNAAVLTFLIESHAVASEGDLLIVIDGKLIGSIGASGAWRPRTASPRGPGCTRSGGDSRSGSNAQRPCASRMAVDLARI